MKELIKKLLHIEDTPKRTALTYSIGVFLGFSPFLGFHTLGGLAIAVLFHLNRIAILIGVWTNTPWWIVPYYTIATYLGMWIVGYRIDIGLFREIFRLGLERGFVGRDFWTHIASQSGLLLSFMVGSLILSTLFALIAYPLSLRWIQFYRSRKKGPEGQK